MCIATNCLLPYSAQLSVSWDTSMAGEMIIAAHSSPTRAYLLEAMVFYGVCTLSCRARKGSSQLITCEVEKEKVAYDSVDVVVCPSMVV